MAKRRAVSRKRIKRGMQNKRYRETEEAIIEVLLKSKEMPSTGELTKRARISRSTLYRHHRAMPGIVPDYEKGILREYERVMRRTFRDKKIDLKGAYLRMLIFVVNYKRVFGILFKYSGDRVVERMVLEIKDKIVETCRLPKKSEKMLRIYAKEIAGIVEVWGEEGFKKEGTEKLLKDIMYLTGAMKTRLGRIQG